MPQTFGEEIMKVFFGLLLSVSLLLNAYFILRGINASAGGGQHKQSPDMKHTVIVNSKRNLNPFSAGKEISAEISLHNGSIADERIRTFTVTPISEASEVAYRELADPIKWSADSREATVTTPDFTLTINVRP